MTDDSHMEAFMDGAAAARQNAEELIAERVRLDRQIGFDQPDIPAEEWRDRYYRCAQRADHATAQATAFREALERIAQRHDIDVNGEYVKRNQPVVSVHEACQIAEAAVAAATNQGGENG